MFYHLSAYIYIYVIYIYIRLNIYTFTIYIPWKSKTKQRMVFRMIHIQDSLLPMGKVWSLDFLGICNIHLLQHIQHHPPPQPLLTIYRPASWTPGNVIRAREPPNKKGCCRHVQVATWRIIPVSKWSITMVSKSPK